MKYPEHEKLKAKEHEAYVLSGFLDMLDERGLILAAYHTHVAKCRVGKRNRNPDDCGLNEERLYTFGMPSKEQLIGFYLGVDPKKLTAEKEAMYRELVAANTQRAITPKAVQPSPTGSG